MRIHLPTLEINPSTSTEPDSNSSKCREQVYNQTSLNLIKEAETVEEEEEDPALSFYMREV